MHKSDILVENECRLLLLLEMFEITCIVLTVAVILYLHFLSCQYSPVFFQRLFTAYVSLIIRCRQSSSVLPQFTNPFIINILTTHSYRMYCRGERWVIACWWLSIRDCWITNEQVELQSCKSLKIRTLCMCQIHNICVIAGLPGVDL